MPENFASYKEKIEAKFTATYLLIKAEGPRPRREPEGGDAHFRQTEVTCH